MRWRPVAAAAAGVVAVVGLNAGKAAAEAADEGVDPGPTTSTTTPSPPLDERSAKLDQAASYSAYVDSLPPYTPKPKPPPPIDLSAPVSAVTHLAPTISIGDDQTAPNPDFLRILHPRGEGSAQSRERKASAVDQARAAMAAEAAAGVANGGSAPKAEPPSAAPVDDPSPNQSSAPSSATYATTTGANTNTSTAALPPTPGSAGAADQWWPTWAGDLVDQRFEAAWRENPVRGPPPGTASALGNDGRTTIYQVSVVTGKDGTEVSISATQSAVVNNRGLAEAGAIGSGSATATGDLATTSIYQTTVVVQRGTGTATVEQATHVDNLGHAVAASAGSENAEAVGNASSTTVHQTAVVLLLGSGDAQLSQHADVTNVGDATAVAIDRQSSASGSTATTDVSQIAVLVVHDDDVTVTQRSSTTNVGVGNATGGTAIGNNSTNTTSQVDVLH